MVLGTCNMVQLLKILESMAFIKQLLNEHPYVACHYGRDMPPVQRPEKPGEVRRSPEKPGEARRSPERPGEVRRGQGPGGRV
jgi:hypothetical protein